MHPKDTEALKTWLTVKLQPLCDADPLALAKYVFALIRKDKPTDALRELCIDQLEVFLGRETLNFVSELFHVLENGVPDMKKELKVSADPGCETDESSGNKQEKDDDNKVKSNPSLNKSISEEPELDDEDRDFKRARKEEDTDGKPAISPITFPTANSAGLLKRKRAVEENRNFSRKSSRVRPPPLLPDAMQYTPSTQSATASTTVNTMERKQRCKDYDEKGFCLLGENCPYDHGADPLVVEGGGFPPPPLNLPSTFLPPMPPQYFMVPPPPSLLPPAVSMPPTTTTTTDTDTTGYNPEQPSLSLSTATTTTPLITITTHSSYTPTVSTPVISRQSETERYHSNRSPTRMNRYQGGGYRHQRMPQEPTNTLVLRKVPSELNVLSKLNGHFEKFGKIVNLKVGFQNDPEAALVQFATVEEAKAAHSSSSAVLGNRFIRVYFMRTPKHHSLTPNAMSVSSICEPDKTNNSTPEVTTNANISEDASPATSTASELPNGRTEVPSDAIVAKQPEQQTNKQPLRSPTTPPAKHKGLPPELIKKQKEVHSKMKSLLDDQLKQQKALIAKLDSSGKMLTAEEKKKVMEMVKTLSTNITKLKGQILHQQAQVRAPLKTLETPPANPPTEKPTAPPPHVRKAPDLRNKLRKKTREIVVCKVAPELKEQLTDAFEKLGGLVQVRYDPANPTDVIFTFRTQVDAKRAVDNGSVFNNKPLIMKWYYQKEEPPVNHTVQKERRMSQSAAEQLQSPAATDNPSLLAEVIEIPDDDEEEEEERSWKR